MPLLLREGILGWLFECDMARWSHFLSILEGYCIYSPKTALALLCITNHIFGGLDLAFCGLISVASGIR